MVQKKKHCLEPTWRQTGKWSCLECCVNDTWKQIMMSHKIKTPQTHKQHVSIYLENLDQDLYVLLSLSLLEI